MREDEQVARRHPRARVRLAARRLGGAPYDSVGLQPLPRGAPPGGPRPVLRDRRRRTACADLDARRPPPVARPDDAAPPARPGRAARAALPRPQDPRRASPTTTDPSIAAPPAARPAGRTRWLPFRAMTAVDDLRAAVLARGVGGRRGAQGAADPRAPAPGRARRLRDQRGDAARRRAQGAASGDRRAPRRRRSPAELGPALERAEVARPRLPEPLPHRRLARATPCTASLAAGDAFGAGHPEAPEQDPRRSSSRPTRPVR